jgi:hypothetical protein
MRQTCLQDNTTLRLIFLLKSDGSYGFTVIPGLRAEQDANSMFNLTIYS